MGWLRKLWRGVDATDTAISWTERALYILFGSSVPGIVSGLLIWLAANLQLGLVAGLVVWLAVLMSLLYKAARDADKPTGARLESEDVPSQPTPADTDPRQSQEVAIDLGDTTNLFLMDGSRFVPEDDSERRTIFLPALLKHWAEPRSLAVEAGRTFVARWAEFDNCDIYGPGVFVLVEGSVEGTFHKCDWEEEWQAFWPATKRGRYVGAIALENCIFRRCNFTGVAFVVKPDEYRRIYRRFTGDEL